MIIKFARKCLIAILLVGTYSYANGFCIIASSSKSLNPVFKNIFLNRYPSGIVEKENKYYVFKISGFTTYKNANKNLINIQKYYSSAFIVNCTLPKPKITVKATKTTKDMTPNIVNLKPPSLDEPTILKKRYLKPLNFTKISKNNKTPSLDEPKILQSYQRPIPSLSDANINYNILSFRRYTSALLDSNNQADISFYQKKIDYILTYIKKDRYNFNVYALAQATTGSYLSPYSSTPPIINGNFDQTTTGVSIHADKLLYDGQYSLIHNQYAVLNQRLADIKQLNAKERLIILATSIYTNMYFDQQRLILFKRIYKAQQHITKIVKNGYKNSTKSIVDYIDAKSTLLSLRSSILNLQTKFIDDDYILRHSINSKAKNRYKLLPISIHWNLKPLNIFKQEVINNNSGIAMESDIFKLRQTDIIAQKRRYYPIVNFTSYAGYGTSNNKIFAATSSGAGAFWQLGLTVRFPIYNRGDIRLGEEKSIYDALKQKKVLSSKIKSTLLQVDHSYTILQMINKDRSIVKEQVDLQSLKMKVVRASFLQGVSTYRVYANAVTSFLRYKLQLLSLQQNYIKEMAILSLLIGKTKGFYESN